MSLQQLHSGFVLLSFIFFVYSYSFVTFCFDSFYLCPLFFFLFSFVPLLFLSHFCPIAVPFFPSQSYRFVYRFGHSLVPATLLSMAEGRSSRRPKQISLKEVFWGEQSTYLRKCLNVHSVCTNFCLNVHSVCTNFCLNVHSPI